MDLLNVNENIYLLNTDAKQLTAILKNSSTLSTKINVQIQELDVARVSNFLLSIDFKFISVLNGLLTLLVSSFRMPETCPRLTRFATM